ncbi:DNA-dependent RNA polymerase auxiliary subunit epsilon [Aquimarina sp. EL_43]|nr:MULTISPECIES: hypothetical protein [Aquimarina]MBG6130681.1 DNA-dependent RNA polymerase auxiliary subunit epsilon [Aquimarina sp. EL_35]MBG6151173.1 DNA-dependent RNA polymerase auxiliary subunit epsilon [Aquimarina sp. EL_32]MBG6169083.1 DNA-dependent RNA polymerase auxiliary subunit epsilon [Aquimarina sp. EL_43]
MKPFREINQSEVAKKKLRSLAKSSNFNVELVTLLQIILGITIL